MNFILSSKTGEFSSEDVIIRQSSDRNTESGLMKYAIHVALRIQAGEDTIYGPWRTHEVDLVPESVTVICSRMGITLEQLNRIGTDYTNLLRAIVDYSQNPPGQSELESLGLAEPVIEMPIPEWRIELDRSQADRQSSA